MNEQEMVIEIRAKIEAHKRNHSALKAAKLTTGFEQTSIDALRTALKNELVKIFEKGYQ